MYTPTPIDTTAVQLPASLKELVEELARNNHDVWARQRIGDGWTLGPARNDESKHHPDLVPYEELPESEKEYDRVTATEILKAIIAMGYRIEEI